MKMNIMVQGTTSDAGKSTLVAALCRVFADRGVKGCALAKPQNMALNKCAVTARWWRNWSEPKHLQAIAAKVEPAEVDFNPILLKPNSDTGRAGHCSW